LTVVLNALRLTRMPSAPAASTSPETRPLPA
jgi:Cu2+-exporting ATPase